MNIVTTITATSTTRMKEVVTLTETEERTLCVRSVDDIELLPVELRTCVSGDTLKGLLLHIFFSSLKLPPKN